MEINKRLRPLPTLFPLLCSSLLLQAHGQVDEGEDVVLNHDGEAEKDGVQHQHGAAQLGGQPPVVQVDAQHLGEEGGLISETLQSKRLSTAVSLVTHA